MSVYIDDIAIHTKPQDRESKEAHHIRHCNYIHLTLNKLEANDLYLKPEKCEFEKEEIKYLGVIIGKNMLRMDPKKLKGVADWPTPCTPIDIQKFLGFTGYYCYFVPNYSKIACLLLDMTKKHQQWEWGPCQQEAMDKLK
jgi:hypothetical protein